MKYLKIERITFFIIFFLIIIWSIFTLPYSPIAWMDEVILSSYAHSFFNGNGIAMELDHGEPVPFYGPVFFVLQALFIKLVGFTPFGLRLCNCLFSFLSVILLGKIQKTLNVKDCARYLILLLFATDTLFLSNSHSGRMEFVALFFVLVAYWLYLEPRFNYIYKAFLISLSLSVAFMTTPRVAVICIPIAIAELYKILTKRAWSLTIVYVLLPILLYCIWIVYAFGSIDSMFSFFTTPNSSSPNASLASRFININLHLFIPKWQYPLIFTAILCVIHSIRYKYLNRILLYVSPICIFYLIVFDTGTYSTLIIPFYLLIIAVCYSEVQLRSEKKQIMVFNTLIICCMALNIAIFVVKSINVMSTINTRDHSELSAWLKNQIPAGSRVAGTYAFYYAAIDNNCSYRKIENESLSAKALHDELINDYNVDYLIISEDQFTPYMLECYSFFDKEKELVGYYKPSNEDLWLNKLIDRFVKKYSILSSDPSYACEVYKIDRNKTQ